MFSPSYMVNFVVGAFMQNKLKSKLFNDILKEIFADKC